MKTAPPPKDQSARWTILVSAFVQRGNHFHVSGRIEGPAPAPASIALQCPSHSAVATKLADGVLSRLVPGAPCQPGLVQMDFSIIGYAAAIPWREMRLVVTWTSGRTKVWPMPKPRMHASNNWILGLIYAPWGHYLRRGWRLLRHGRLVELFAVMTRMFALFFATTRNPDRLLQWMTTRPESRTLIFDHNLGGGSGRFREQLVDELRRDGKLVVLVTANNGLGGYQLAAMPPLGATRNYFIGTAERLHDFVRSIQPDETYLNHLVSFPNTPGVAECIGRLARKSQLGRFIFLLHDFYSICPSWSLINHQGRFCGIPDLASCATCLPRLNQPFLSLAQGLDVTQWRSLWLPILRSASEIRCFSNASRSLLHRAFPELPDDRLTVLPHHSDRAPLRPVKRQASSAPVIGVVGSINLAKGARVLTELCTHMQQTGSHVRLIVIGTVEIDLPPPSVVTGPYDRDRLPQLLESHGVNVALLPSICPETYSYATDELMQMRLPLICFDVGAPPERVSDYSRGLVVSEQSPQTVIDAAWRLHKRFNLPSGVSESEIG